MCYQNILKWYYKRAWFMFLNCGAGAYWLVKVFTIAVTQWAWNEPRLTRGAAQIGLRTFFTCGPLIMELSITKSRIELIKTYFTFLLSRNVDDFKVITTGLFHFCVNMNGKNTLKLYLKCSWKTTYIANEHK